MNLEWVYNKTCLVHKTPGILQWSLGETALHREQRGKRGSREGRKGGREGGERDGMEEKGREEMRDRVASSFWCPGS